ncbi:MAG: MFS transporter [Thermomicrobiales bacterium]
MRRLPIATLLATNLISGLGNAMTSLAVPWFVLETTGSASRTGLTAAVALVPMVVMSFFGGALVDRTGRRGLSIFADVMSAVFLAAIPILHIMGWLSFPLLLLMMFMGAIFDSPGYTARQAMVPDLAARGDVGLERVNSLFGVNQAVSMLAGAPIAGLMIAWLGAVNVLWFATGTFVISILGMLLFVPALPRAEPSGENFLEDVKQGARYVWGSRMLRTAILASLVVNLVISPLFGVAAPVLARDIFGDASDLGIMMSGFGAGILLGSVAFGWLGKMMGARKLVLIAIGGMGAGLAGIAATTSLPAIWGLLFVVGVCSGITNPLMTTVMQARTPAEMLGRVFGTLGAGSMLATPLGMILGGVIVSRVGPGTTFLIGGIVILGVCAACVISPALHDLDAPAPPLASAAMPEVLPKEAEPAAKRAA